MKHLLNKEKLVKISLNEMVQKINNIYLTEIEIPKSLVKQFITKCKQEPYSKDLADTFSESKIAEMIAKYIEKTFLNIDSLSVEGILGEEDKNKDEVKTVVAPGENVAPSIQPTTPQKNVNQPNNVEGEPTGSVQEGKINETGEWVGDDDQTAWLESLRSDCERIESEVPSFLLLSVKGFDNYQGPYANVQIDGKNYQIWTMEHDTLWIENYPIDNTSSKESAAGFQGTVDEIIDMLNNQ